MPASEVSLRTKRTKVSMIRWKIFIKKVKAIILLNILALVIHTLIIGVFDIFLLLFWRWTCILIQKF